MSLLELGIEQGTARFVGLLALGLAGCSLPQNPARAPSAITGGDWPPVIGAWFWSPAVLEPDGFKPFLDSAATNSPYTLLSTSCRQIEVVDPALHDQVSKALRYAKPLGMEIALEVDIRLARQAFRAKHPEELQEELVLKMASFPMDGPADVVFQGRDTSDHMNGSLPKYECLTTRLVRVYSFVKGSDGIDPATVEEVLRAAGFDAQAMLALTQDAAVKEELKTVTQAAVERGIFGAPTFFVGNTMFWGQDRLDFVREALTD